MKGSAMWFSALLRLIASNSLHPRTHRAWRQHTRNRHCPALESLEDRLALATYNVFSSADSGAGTLRQAILDANGSSGADHIQFNIPGGGVHTIQPFSPLPSITDAVTI